MRRALVSRLLGSTLFVGSLALLPTIALAVAPRSLTGAHKHADRPIFALESGKDASLPVTIRWGAAPQRLASAWKLFEADVGKGAFWAGYREATGVPVRLYGRGIPAPGTIADAAVAEGFARAMLTRHASLLAPGSRTLEVELVANDLDTASGIRTLGFAQKKNGLRVRGGQLSFRFKADRLVVIASEALPDVVAVTPSTKVTRKLVEKSALALAAAEMKSPVVDAVESDPVVLPFMDEQGQLAFRTVFVVKVHAKEGVGKLDVFVDATEGTAIASENKLRYANGVLSIAAPKRSPSFDVRQPYPARFLNLNVGGTAQKSDGAGNITFTGASTSVEAFMSGDEASVNNDNGPEATSTFTLADAGAFTWDGESSSELDAQLASLVHAGRVREYAKAFAPELSFLNAPVQVTVNIDDQCNAFSDGTTINFFRASGQCENTGRIADVVYHEYGHSLHNHAIIQGVGAFEGALSEGVSDYLSATITNDPSMGRGFFFDQNPLRELEPSGENRWPDDLIGEVHEDGLIIGQTLWDLRTALIAKLGPVAGVTRADFLYYQGIRRAVDIPTMYVEVLTADDDDGDLENGTPNVCEINTAFELHGIRAFSAESTSFGVTPAEQEGYTVTVKLAGVYPQCAADQLSDAELTWRRRGSDATEKITMTGTTNELTATMPKQDEGTLMEYTVDLTFNTGSNLFLPANAADRWYQFYVGEVTPIYCTDFEADPNQSGWTHGLESGSMSEGADDWEWGRPHGDSANGDPEDAFSGKNVFGNDLAKLQNFNGLYQPDKVNWAKSPSVDVAGFERVRLQYRRWLNIEDGHFDRATIYANDTVAWQNVDSDMGDNNSKTHHRDREWRFHDLDVTDLVKDGKLEIKYEIASDQGLEFGGWTLDDFCIVGTKASDPCADDGCGGAGGEGGAGGGAGGGSGDEEVIGGCGCKTVSTGGDDSAWMFAGSALAIALIRRRRRAA